MIKQRSKEWFDVRRGKITGSIAGAILNLNKYKSRKDVMREMVRSYHGLQPDFVGNKFTQYGIDNEPLAIESFEKLFNVEVSECSFVVSNQYEWLGASPDGFIESENALLEIKCPFPFRKIMKFKSIDDIPHYYAQVQIQMFCTEVQRCWFYQWSDHSHKVELVDINYYWLSDALDKLEAFHKEFLTQIHNPEHLETEITK